MRNLEPWLTDILANPVTKQSCQPDAFKIDDRVFLKNTHGNSDWGEGQDFYENDFEGKDSETVEAYRKEINYDLPIYQHYQMSGHILGCGGGGQVV